MRRLNRKSRPCQITKSIQAFRLENRQHHEFQDRMIKKIIGDEAKEEKQIKQLEHEYDPRVIRMHRHRAAEEGYR